jgi:hypothetical protein
MSERTFVARERELAQLQGFLDSVLADHTQCPAGGQVCFVVGEAGSGTSGNYTTFGNILHE